ncbi:unnamed protein product [Caenorhabditis sp. 36 PRJEB53466]|nr:unnamed protein product [Caenorhabditis sp. 36 PRJEB53466]
MSFVDVLAAKPKEPELYRVLGCDEKSSTDQIIAEYRARVREAHPDKTTAERSREATEKFHELQNAYTILTDKSRRRAYDSWLHSPFPVTFDEFSKSLDTFQMSTHWAVPKSQPSIAMPHENMKISENSQEKLESRWAEGDRYQSSIASAFRNYKL